MVASVVGEGKRPRYVMSREALLRNAIAYCT